MPTASPHRHSSTRTSLAGLIAITPCARFVGGPAPLIIGSAAGALCFLAQGIKEKMDWDDSLDVIAVHLIGGVVGTLLFGFFADTAINSEFDGIFLVTFALAKIIVRTMGLRLDEDAELQGLDQSQHAESAYTS